MQKAGQAWTFVGFGQASSGQDGRAGAGAMRRTMRALGLRQFGLEVFCPWRPLEVIKPWQARIFAVVELAPSMTPKSYWVQKPESLKVMHIVAPKSHNT